MGMFVFIILLYCCMQLSRAMKEINPQTVTANTHSNQQLPDLVLFTIHIHKANGQSCLANLASLIKCESSSLKGLDLFSQVLCSTLSGMLLPSFIGISTMKHTSQC